MLWLGRVFFDVFCIGPVGFYREYWLWRLVSMSIAFGYYEYRAMKQCILKSTYNTLSNAFQVI